MNRAEDIEDWEDREDNGYARKTTCARSGCVSAADAAA